MADLMKEMRVQRSGNVQVCESRNLVAGGRHPDVDCIPRFKHPDVDCIPRLMLPDV
jgi:hypothetical protein